MTVHGAAPYPNPPLLQVAHAEVGVRIVSVLQQKWYLDSFVVDHPVVKMFTDAHGVTNIPVIKSSSSSSSNTSLFDLGIRHAVLDQGAVYYNDRQSVLSADLHNVDFRASFDSALQKYSGKLSYSDGHLQSGSFKPIPHNLEAEFDATPTTFHLSQAKLTSESSQLVLTATVQDYSHPQVQAHYAATLDASQFRRILENPSVPVGLIRASGSVAYQEAANRSLLDTVVVHGDLNSKQLDVQTPALRSQIRDIAAHYSLAKRRRDARGFPRESSGRRAHQHGQDEQHRRQRALELQCLFARHPACGCEPRHEIVGHAKERCLRGRAECTGECRMGKDLRRCRGPCRRDRARRRVTGTGNGAPRLFPWRAQFMERIRAATRSSRSSRVICARRKAR